MAENKSLIENISQEPLINQLKNMLQGLFIYTGSENNINLSDYFNILIDFKYVVQNSNQFVLNTLINNALDLGKRLILLNVHSGKYLSKMIGMGFKSKCIIIRPYNKYNVFNALGLYESDMYDCGESHVTQTTHGSRYFNIKSRDGCEYSISEWQSSFENLSVTKQAKIIESILYSDFKIPEEFREQSLVSTPAALPKEQFKLNYLVIESKWNLSYQQVANNSVVMEILLIASYNPQYKYLRIRSLGEGFNPTNGAEMQHNSTYDRGYFQSNVKIHIQPNTDKLRTLSTEPKNVKNQAQYTTSSEFSVGVDVSKNPTFNSSYTISESMTTVVSDFHIYNNSAGIIADWDFNQAITENSIWDIFEEEFLKKAKLKALPELATKKLQPVTEAVWYTENTLNKTIGVQIYWKVDYYHCWVTGNWADYTQHYKHIWRTVGYQDVPVYIDFSSVYV